MYVIILLLLCLFLSVFLFVLFRYIFYSSSNKLE